MMISAFLGHVYSQTSSSASSSFSGKTRRLCKFFSTFFRCVGKALAILNTIILLSSGILELIAIFDNCYCDSSVLGRGPSEGFATIVTDWGIDALKAVCGGGATLVVGTGVFVVGVWMMVDEPLKDDVAMVRDSQCDPNWEADRDILMVSSTHEPGSDGMVAGHGTINFQDDDCRDPELDAVLLRPRHLSPKEGINSSGDVNDLAQEVVGVNPISTPDNSVALLTDPGAASIIINA
jgi:hypothetical protein